MPLSFRLHAELAARYDGPRRWGYRRLKCGSISATVSSEKIASFTDKSPRGSVSTEATAIGAGAGDEKDWQKLPKQDEHAARLLEEAGVPPDLNWVDPETLEGYAEMGGPGTTDTAQVHPLEFTTAMAELAAEKGVEIRTGALVTLIKTTKTAVERIEYIDRKTGETHTIEDFTDVVVCAGPWTGKLLPKTRVEGLRAHSVVFEADVTPYAVFTDIVLPSDYVPPHRARKGQKRRHKGSVDPEVYARPNNEVYACGKSNLSLPAPLFLPFKAPLTNTTACPVPGEPDTTIPLPETADLVQTDPSQCDDLISYLSTISPALRAAPIKARQACYIPRHMRFGDERGPLVGPTSMKGLWVAAGHTCWGIQNGPATGCLMAEWILEGRVRSADVVKLDPRTFKV